MHGDSRQVLASGFSRLALSALTPLSLAFHNVLCQVQGESFLAASIPNDHHGEHGIQYLICFQREPHRPVSKALVHLADAGSTATCQRRLTGC